MVSVTLSIPADIKERMDKFSWVNWSGLARETFIKKMDELEMLEKITSKSKMTQEDADTLAEKITKGMHKKYKKQFGLV